MSWLLPPQSCTDMPFVACIFCLQEWLSAIQPMSAHEISLYVLEQKLLPAVRCWAGLCGEGVVQLNSCINHLLTGSLWAGITEQMVSSIG